MKGQGYPMIDVLNMATDLAYWVMLNYFILEMKTVRDVLTAATNKEFNENIKVTSRLRAIVLPLISIAGATFRFLVGLKLYGYAVNNSKSAVYLQLISRCITLGLQTVFAVMWF